MAGLLFVILFSLLVTTQYGCSQGVTQRLNAASAALN